MDYGITVFAMHSFKLIPFTKNKQIYNNCTGKLYLMMLPGTSFCKCRNSVRHMKLSYKLELEKQHLIAVSATSSLVEITWIYNRIL